MIALALAENVVARQADTIRRDAEALLTVAAWADLPAGLVILPTVGRPDASGLSIGSGHTLARAIGCRPRVVAVRVDVGGILRPAVEAAPFDPEAAVSVARPLIEGVAVHEAAHAIVAVLDADTDAELARQVIEACDRGPIRTGADAHGPAWAAAVVVLTRRVMSLRPADERADRDSIMRADLLGYGLDADAIAEALGDVDADASLRELLAPGGSAVRRVAAVCLPDDERQRRIEHRRSHGAVGGMVDLLFAKKAGVE